MCFQRQMASWCVLFVLSKPLFFVYKMYSILRAKQKLDQCSSLFTGIGFYPDEVKLLIQCLFFIWIMNVHFNTQNVIVISNENHSNLTSSPHTWHMRRTFLQQNEPIAGILNGLNFYNLSSKLVLWRKLSAPVTIARLLWDLWPHKRSDGMWLVYPTDSKAISRPE